MSWWMALPLRVKGLVVVALPLIPLLTSLAILLWLGSRHERIDERVQLTLAVRAQADRVLKSALDAETGVRGYVITEDEVFLEPYRAAQTELPRAVASLRRLAQSDDLSRIARVDSLVERQRAILKAVVAGERSQSLLQDGRADETVEKNLLQQGKATMDSLRHVLALQVADEQQELAQARVANERIQGNFLKVVAGTAISGAAAGFLAMLLLVAGVVHGVNDASVNARRLTAGLRLAPTSKRGDEIGQLSRALEEAELLLSEQEARRATAEAKLRESEERFRFLVENSSDVVARIAPDGVIRYVSPAAPLLGYGPEQLVGRSAFELIHEDDLPQVLAVIARVLESGDSAVVAYRGRQKDGRHRWFEATGKAVVDADGAVTELQATLRDISERKAAEQAVREANETLEERVRARTVELEEARYEILQRLAYAAEYRDDDTHEHTERVAEIAAIIARGLGLSADEVEIVKLAAPLHDIGKIGIPDAILLKPGRLTEAEFAQIQEHAAIGAKILAGSRSQILNAAEVIALTHHERWDGSGYPHGRAGEDIPLHGRIVAVADVFDALTHERPYKKAWPLDDAIAEVTQQSGRAFDPAVVDAFLAFARGTHRSDAATPERV